MVLKDIKKIMELRKQAKDIQAKLKKIHIEAQDSKNLVNVKMDAEQNVLSTEILVELSTVSSNDIEAAFVEAFNKAIKKSQEIAAENMKGILGDLSAGM